MTSKDRLILLVEDNEQILKGNRRFLERQGYKTAAAPNLAEAHALIGTCRPDVIILDIMLPDGSGLDFMGRLRESKYADIPILLLTGLITKEDVVRGLMVGGDDYLTKPYDFPELLALVEALLRRAERVPETVHKGRLSLDVTVGAAVCDGADLLLTQKEFALLLTFIRNEGRYMDTELPVRKSLESTDGKRQSSFKEDHYASAG